MCELALRQFSKCSCRSDGGFVEVACGGLWPTTEVGISAFNGSNRCIAGGGAQNPNGSSGSLCKVYIATRNGLSSLEGADAQRLLLGRLQ